MICTKCKTDKPTEDFNEDQNGCFRTDCKVCQSAYNASYYAKNKERLLKYQDDYRLNKNEQIMKARKKRVSYLNTTIAKIIGEVDTRRGAPMGRPNIGEHPVLRKAPIKMKVFNCYVPMCIGDQAYDKGGAYWGLSPNRLRVSYTKDLSYIKFYRENESE